MLFDTQVTVQDVGTGDQAILNTVERMRQLIQAGTASWEVRFAAAQLLRDVRERDPIGEVNALFRFVQQASRYTHDPLTLELLHTPDVSLRLIRENGYAALDCDDGSILFSSLARSVGYPVRLKVISTNPQGEFNHVYSLVKIRGLWVPADTIRKDRPLGWEAPNVTRQMIVRI